MPNLVSFKVYLNKIDDGENIEVRRLSIEQDVATSYSYLIEKLKNIFPCLQDASGPLHLHWKDSDNDEVTISSDAELIIALTEMDDPLKKIYIRASPACQEEFQPDLNCIGEGDVASDFHVGITCDGCDGSVTGFRYKCVQCPDFDLCSTCEAKCLHPEHLMLRIPTPINRLLDVKVCSCSGKKKGRCCCDAGGRATRDAQSEYPLLCPFSRKHSKRHSKHHGTKLLAEHHRLARPWIEAVTQIINSADRQISRHAPCTDTGAQRSPPHCGSATRERSSDEKCQRSVQRNETTAAPNACGDVPRASAPAAPETSSSTSASEPTRPAPTDNNSTSDLIKDLFNTVGPIVAGSLQKQGGPIFEFINEILSDATRNNDNEKPACDRTNSRETADNKPPESTSSTVNSAEVVKQSPSRTDTVCKSVSENSSSSASQSKTATLDVNKLVDGIQHLAVNSGAASSRQSETIRTVTGETAEAASPISIESQSSNDDGIRVKGINVEQKEEEDGWTLLTEGSAKKSTVASPNSGNSTGAIPKTTAPDKGFENAQQQQGSLYPELVPLQDKVSVSLGRMLAMGFTNEGNWLGDLLMKNNGDVAAVIDLLIPTKRNAF